MTSFILLDLRCLYAEFHSTECRGAKLQTSYVLPIDRATSHARVDRQLKILISPVYVEYKWRGREITIKSSLFGPQFIFTSAHNLISHRPTVYFHVDPLFNFTLDHCLFSHQLIIFFTLSYSLSSDQPKVYFQISPKFIFRSAQAYIQISS
jgi:hypothetical protein